MNFIFDQLMKNKRPGYFITFLILAWLAVLSNFILFKKSPGYYKRYFKSGQVRDAAIRENKAFNNYTLFATIRRFYESKRIRKQYLIDNIGGNITGFIPLGFLVPLLFPGRWKAIKTILGIFLISLCFEVIQLETGWGVFDVDDLLLNTAGGCVGLLLYYSVRWMVSKSGRPAN